MENKVPPNQKEQIQNLQTELNSVKSQLDQSNTSQKTQLENKLLNLERQINNLTNRDKSTIQRLEQELKEIKKTIEGKDKPNEDDDNPNPQPNNKGFNFVSTKMNDNTYKYKIALDVNGSEIDFANFIIFLKTKDKHFFKVFQGALKDANSKFPAYF